MKNSNQFQSWLSCIWHLYPPTALAHIGAGYGPSVIPYADWGVEHALLVDADSNACTQLVKSYATRHNWQIKEALIAPGTDAAVFHVASSPAESSLLDPERIRQFWPNLRISEDAERPQATLEAIISESFSGKAFPNWLVFGGFQAEALLASTPNLLKNVEVICARVITKAGHALDCRAHLDSLNSLMAGNGFHLVGVEEERNPAIGHALFVRDYKSLTRLTSLQLSQAKAEAEKQLAERSAQLTQANQAKDAQAKLAAERQTQIEQLSQAKAEAEKHLAERSAQLTQANQTKDAQAKLAAERQTQIEQLSQAKAESEKQLAERSAQLTQAHQAKDAQAKLVAERQTQIERLTQAKDEAEKQRSDLLARQQLMQGEIARAEAQIDLVKELLLQENSL